MDALLALPAMESGSTPTLDAASSENFTDPVSKGLDSGPAAVPSSEAASIGNSADLDRKGTDYESDDLVSLYAACKDSSTDLEEKGELAATVLSYCTASRENAADRENMRSDSASPGTPILGRKNRGIKDSGHSVRYSVNKFAQQFKKTPHRRSPPLNWFPRKKTDSFLKRKIRHLQEVEGMNLSLDETLGNANRHYTRMAREKIAAREAARKAMEAHKAAMVEASWCRILRAARIQSTEAEAELEKAEKCAVEAFEAARRMGVMMYDRPDCPWQPCETESSSTTVVGSIHNVTASFKTAFEVDKEVAAAVKEAFKQLGNCTTYSNKEEFRDLLRKISENPDNETDRVIMDIHSESEFNSNAELGPELHGTDFNGDDAVSKHELELKYRTRSIKHSIGCNISSQRNSSKSFIDLVCTMLDRLKGLQEDELASLAIIVATCGLNAALLEVESGKDRDSEPVTNCQIGVESLGTATRRNYGVTHFIDGHMGGRETATELPSLDKLLVKHVSRLEREVQEARNSKKINSVLGCPKTSGDLMERTNLVCSNRNSTSSESTSDLGSILVKHVSKLEREIQEAKNSRKKNTVSETGKTTETESSSAKSNSTEPPSVPILQLGEIPVNHQSQIIDGNMGGKETATELPSLDELLVNRVSRLEREVQEASNSKKINSGASRESVADRYLVYLNSSSTSSESASDLGSILVKHVSKLQREIQDGRHDKENVDLNTLVPLSSTAEKVHLLGTEETGKAPVKHVSRIERAKLEALKAFSSVDGGNAGLDKILVKSVHRLQREKMQVSLQETDYTIKRNIRKQGTEVTSSESLDKVLVKHVSGLEKERMAMGKREDIVVVKKRNSHSENMESLDDILVKHQPKLEKSKLASAQESEDHIKHVDARRQAREREFQEAWGGLSLGNSMQPHLSRLERDKAAWRRAEKEERMRDRLL